MSTNDNDTGPPLPKDRLGRRLAWSILVSVLVNAALWRYASQVVHNHIVMPPPPLTFRLLSPPPKPKPPRKIVRKVIHKIAPQIVRPKPKSIVKTKPIVTPKVIKPAPVLRPMPPAAHHSVLTAHGPSTVHHTVISGGYAQIGVPIARQNVGEGSNNAQAPTPLPQPVPQSTPSAPAPKPTTAPPPPKPQPPSEPSGPTQDATPSHQVLPDIPDDLKTGNYSSSVRVKVQIAADGTFAVTLLTSSGDLDIDGRVLDALKHWKWKPALQDGQPIASTQRFRFDFQVQ